MWRTRRVSHRSCSYYHHGSFPSSIFTAEATVFGSRQLLSRFTSSSSAVDSSASASGAPAESVNSGILRGRFDGVRAFSSSSSIAATDLSSFTSSLQSVRRYGHCYWELSKARLSMLVVATSGTGYVLGSGSAVDFAGLC